jgi:ribosomal-protein-alanine N-acetyltransferase
MNIELKEWNLELRDELIRICNAVNRTYLSNRLPNPYTEKYAEFWLGMVAEREGKSGVYRAIYYEGELVGNISVEQMDDVYIKNGEIGLFILDDYKSKGVMTEAVRQICKLAFSKLDIIRISGAAYEPNTASRRVLEKTDSRLKAFRKTPCSRAAIYMIFAYMES